MLEAMNLFYKTSGKTILKNCNITLKQGNMTALIGKNGSGKTTLLKVLSGEYNNTTGTVLIKDQKLSNINNSELSKIRAVFNQQQNINFGFTVREVVAMGRTPHFGTYASIQDNEIVDSCLKEMELEDLCFHDIRRLSGGERQRVHIARVIAQLVDQEPNNCLYFFDEPTNNLDIYYQHKIMSILKGFAIMGFTICIVVHDLNLVSEYMDQVYILNDGEIIADGNPKQALTENLISRLYKQSTKKISHPERSHDIIVF